MAKIMLVEDDNNLREIYEARLLAEGHEIVSARDGEEALALAVREKPDLIISDVMMPKISGFDMLDILRSSPETKNTKIIMMTALSQIEDKDRADKLGADRYLVKSQVTLEDVIRVSQELLEGPVAESEPASTDPAPIIHSEPASSAGPVLEAITTDSTTPDTPAADALSTTQVPQQPANDSQQSPATTDPVLSQPATDDSTATQPDPALNQTPATDSAGPAITDTSSKPSASDQPGVDSVTTMSLEDTTSVLQSATAVAMPSTVASEPQPTALPEPEAQAPQSETSEQSPVTPEALGDAQTINDEQETINDQVAEFVSSASNQPPQVNISEDGTVSSDSTSPEETSAKQDLVIPAGPLAPKVAEPLPQPINSPSPAPEPESPESITEIPPTPDLSTSVPSAEPVIPTFEPQSAPVPAPPEAQPTVAQDQPVADEPVPTDTPAQVAAPEADNSSPAASKRIIQPLHDPATTPDLNTLLAKEEEKEQMAQALGDAGVMPPPSPTPQPGHETAPEDGKEDPNMVAL